MHRRLRIHSLVLVLTVAVALGACARESPSTQNRPTEWNVIIAEPTGGGDPLSEYGTNAQYYLMGHVLEGLVHIEMLPDGSAWGVINDLAERWSFPDPTTLLVELKRGVRFHNGETLTAEHVKYAYDALMTADK